MNGADPHCVKCGNFAVVRCDEKKCGAQLCARCSKRTDGKDRCKRHRKAVRR